MSSRRNYEIANILDFNCDLLPFTYLGVPIFRGKLRTRYLQLIADKIHVKLSSWKGVILSITGMVQLINSVISGMLTYSFHVYL